MSAFGNSSKDSLVDEMKRFLEDHPVSELLDIVRYAVEESEWSKSNDK